MMENPETKQKKSPPNISRRSFVKIAAVATGVMATGTLSYDNISRFLRGLSAPEYKDFLSRVIEDIKQAFPRVDQWAPSKEFSTAIYQGFTENKLDKFPFTPENLGLVLTLIAHESGFRTSSRVDSRLPGLTEDRLKGLGLQQPQTGGPMEVDILWVMEEEGLTYDEAYERVSDITGGIYFGIKRLAKLMQIYSSVDNPELKMLCILADYNAGPYASRNAGIQRFLNDFTDSNFRENGLISDVTMEAIKKLMAERGAPIKEKDAVADLRKRFSDNLYDTRVWQALAEYNGGPLPPVPADKPILGKVKRAISTEDSSRQYADKRLEEFRKIMEILKNNRK